MIGPWDYCDAVVLSVLQDIPSLNMIGPRREELSSFLTSLDYEGRTPQRAKWGIGSSDFSYFSV